MMKFIGVVLGALLFVVPPAFADTFPSEIQVTLSNVVLSDYTNAPVETFSASFDVFTNFACSSPSTCGYIPLSISSSGLLGTLSFGFSSTDLTPMGQVTGTWPSDATTPLVSFTDSLNNQIEALFVYNCLNYGDPGMCIASGGYGGGSMLMIGSYGTFPLNDPNSFHVSIESYCGAAPAPCPPMGMIHATSGTITFSAVPEPSVFVLLAVPLAFILLTVPKKNFA
jgi:hypothetical protein